jgi:Zn-dependent protease with chaperone function
LSLPITFLAGLLVLFGNRELAPPVPGSGRIELLAPFALLLLLPMVLAALALRFVRAELITGRRSRVPPRALLRLSGVATLLALQLVLDRGGWCDLSNRWAGESNLLAVGLSLLPLYAAEVPRLLVATAAEFHLEVAAGFAMRRFPAAFLPALAEFRSMLRGRLGWPLLLAMPCVLFGLALDLVQTDRSLHALLLGTTPGATFGTLAFLAVASMLLPPWFRVAFGVVRHLPEPTGGRLRAVAEALGFSGSRVTMLPTGMWAMNAMMVGPLPVGRFLCVTDGLVRTLDEDSLAGVVAHEVGHAKKGHPLLLMTFAVVVPLLLAAPLRALQIDDLDVTTQALLGLGVIFLIWAIVRGLARRFELEADAASVQALGAGPCSRALMVLTRAAVPVSHGFLRRQFSLHPEESVRWEFMRRYESDPVFRTRFEAGGRRLRWLAAGIVAVAASAASWAWAAEWPLERAIWRFYAGDIASAERAVAEVGANVPRHWRQTWPLFLEEVAAASEMAPEARDWESARVAFAAQAWPRGVEVLLQQGPAAARPWFTLALDADPRAEVWRRAVSDYCRAAAHDDTERMSRAKAVVRRLGVPAELRPVFEGEIRPQ